MCVTHGAKIKAKRCSYEECTNLVINGGVCIRHGAKRIICSNEGCTNVAKNGGVCVKHGATVKRCTYEGCTNQAKRRGVCKRHGDWAHPKPNEESTAFSLSRRSAFDETTATLPNQRTNATFRVQNASIIPPSVILCQVANYTEV